MRIKPALPKQLPLSCAATLLAYCAAAQTWQTVDDFQYVPGNGAQGAEARALTVDPFGNVFVAGFGADPNDNNREHALIRKSSDLGATWALVDDFASPYGYAFYGSGAGTVMGGGIGSDAAGNVYGVGRYNGGHGYEWFVSQSTNGGARWNNVDTAGPVAWALDVAADSGGNVYAVGFTNETVVTTTMNKNGSTTTSTNTYSVWLVRKGSNGGTSWATVDQFTNPDRMSGAHAVLCHPTLGIFVTGSSNSVWITRRSLDGGTTWATVDSSTLYTDGLGIGADASGNLYAVGILATSPTHWLTRKSSDGGNSWTTVDDYYTCVTVTNSLKPFRTSTTCYYARAFGFAADAKGNLFVAGYQASTNGDQWIVRENPGGNTSWQTVDAFQYVAGSQSVAYRVAADTVGNVYVAGVGTAPGGVSHWLVRKLSTP